MLTAMRVLPVLLTNTALPVCPLVWPDVLLEPLVTAMRVAPVVLLEHMLTAVAMCVLPVLLTNSA